MTPNTHEIMIVPILSDNYVFVLREHQSKQTVVIDPGEAAPIIDVCKKQGWSVDMILLTHHHDDHIGGVQELVNTYQSKVIGPGYIPERLPHLDRPVQDGDAVDVGQLRFDVWHMPGHTKDHIAYVDPKSKIVFSGDVLFGMGCGRLFEGTFEQMYKTLSRFRSLPADTKIYCTHEYTLTNAKFAKQVLPTDTAIQKRFEETEIKRSRKEYTVPLLLSEELATNPFLRAKNLPEFQAFREARNKF